MTRSVSFLWVGNSLSQYERLCLKSFVDLGYQANLYTYNALSDVPDGIQMRDAGTIIGSDSVFENFHEKGTFAAFSNIFRYRLLQEVDTVWADTDVMALKNSLPKGPYLMGWEDSNLVNGAVLAAPKSSVLLKNLCANCARVEPSELTTWGTLGPRLITAELRKLDMTSLAQDTHQFYPIHYTEVWKFFDPFSTREVEERIRNSSLLHLWNEDFRRVGTRIKQMKPPHGSFMHNQFLRLDIETPAGPSMNPAWVRSVWRKSSLPSKSRVLRMLDRGIRWASKSHVGG